MAGTVIVGSGGGHKAMNFLSHSFQTFTADEQAAAVAAVQELIRTVNQRFGTSFDENNP